MSIVDEFDIEKESLERQAQIYLGWMSGIKTLTEKEVAELMKQVAILERAKKHDHAGNVA